jgi:hypothetical protein
LTPGVPDGCVAAVGRNMPKIVVLIGIAALLVAIFVVVRRNTPNAQPSVVYINTEIGQSAPTSR